METKPRRVFRLAAAAVLACAPVPAVLAASGCSDDESPVGMISVDPGGTYGAEVGLDVRGRGRVISTTGSAIDCPGRCFASLVADDRSGPIQSIGLEAIPTPGIRFLGWSFESVPVGGRGRGPDRCNPVTRPAVAPAVDTNAPTITLPFGEVEGTPPAANAAECAATYAVPLAYRVVARFETEPPIVDAGADGGGGGDVFAEPPAAGAVAREIGVTTAGYAIWRWDQTGVSGVSTASTAGGGAVTVDPATSPIMLFEVDPAGAVWQRADGSLHFLPGGSFTPVTLSGAPPMCSALAMDATSVHCRTPGPNGSIVSWTTGGTGPTTSYAFLPAGSDLVADTSYFFFSGDTGSAGGGTIYYGTRPGPGDGGTFTPVVTGRTGPRALTQAGSTRLVWLEASGGLTSVASNSSRFAATVYTTVAPEVGLAHVVPDPLDSTYVWAATTSTITHAVYTGTATQTFRSGLVGLGGLAADTQYVYWTQSDGRVYRASRSGI